MTESIVSLSIFNNLKFICYIIFIAVLVLFLGGCLSKRCVTTNDVTPWALTVEPTSKYEETAKIISRIVTAFNCDHTPVSIPIRFIGTPGWRFCGAVYTVGCNTKPDQIDFDPEWAAYVVGHDLFHVFAEQLGNINPGRDPFHKDPRWPSWDRWRDKYR